MTMNIMLAAGWVGFGFAWYWYVLAMAFLVALYVALDLYSSIFVLARRY